MYKPDKPDIAWIVYGYTGATNSVVQVHIYEWNRDRTVLAMMPPLFGDKPIPIVVHCDQLFYSQALAEAWALANPPRRQTPQ